MGNEFFWIGIFAIQGVLVDVLIIIIVLFSALFLLYKWVNYKIREQQALREAVAAHKAESKALYAEVDRILAKNKEL